MTLAGMTKMLAAVVACAALVVATTVTRRRSATASVGWDSTSVRAASATVLPVTATVSPTATTIVAAATAVRTPTATVRATITGVSAPATRGTSTAGPGGLTALRGEHQQPREQDDRERLRSCATGSCEGTHDLLLPIAHRAGEPGWCTGTRVRPRTMRAKRPTTCLQALDRWCETPEGSRDPRINSRDV
jgi:hypothetical protein